MSAISHVVAGVSGSPRGLPALRYAAALARGHGAALIPARCPVVAVPPSPLRLEAGHGLRGWMFRHRGLSPRELTASGT